MNVSLTPELEHYIGEKLQSGMYHSVSEVIREGLRLLREQDALNEIHRDELRREIRKEFESVGNGEFTEYDRSSTIQIADEVKATGRHKRAFAATTR